MKVVTLLSLVGSAAAHFVTTGASFKLTDLDYYVSPYSQGRASAETIDTASLPRAFGFSPVTVVTDDLQVSSLEALFANWTSKDDVWQPSFLSTIFLAGHEAASTEENVHEDVASSAIYPLDTSSKIPSGPYFMDTASGELFQAFRLYSDFSGAFSESFLQTPEETFQPLSAHISGSASLTIGVPSRLYFTPTAEKPLAGVRIGVKEIYDLAGTKKSNGNRAWWDLYPAAERTAPCIQNLIDAGGIVVGYQKTSQFANGEAATADWVDFHAPFNPRGDGYNQPSSSSAGAGSSMASYEWLDLAVGSDTGGSIRGPAAVNGLFGNRPSHSLVTLDNVMPLSPTLDTAGFLVRDPAIWDAANKAMYQDNYTSLAETAKVQYPTTIYKAEFPESDDEAGRMMNDFADQLAAMIGGKLTELDMREAWNDTAPEEAAGVTLDELLSTTYATLITKEQIELVREPFYADYAAAHDGRLPYVNPVPIARWSWGDSAPDAWHADALRNKTIFMDWFNSEILVPATPHAHAPYSMSNSSTQCSSAIMLYPGSMGRPNRRDRYFDAAGGPPLGSFSMGRISIFAEAPDNVFPLGEVARESDVTGQEEMLPVSVNVLVAKGCDGLLPRLAMDLVEEGVLSVPRAGGTLEGGEVLMRRGLEEAWAETY